MAVSGWAQSDNASRDRNRETAGNPGQRRAQTETDATKVRVTRATNYLGSDVYASDGRKVGDIVDFVFDISQQPHLAYVIVMTGGFLDMGGDTRAVPASAVSTEDERCNLSISSSEFWDVPVLPGDRHRFLSDSQNAQEIASHFGDSKSRQSKSNRQGQRQLVSFGSMRNEDVYSDDGNRLGYCVDAWISLDQNRSPYVEITPTFQPFRTNWDLRYAIPTSRFTDRDGFGYTANISSDDLTEADSISETEGVRMLESGEIGEAVLRVRLAQR